MNLPVTRWRTHAPTAAAQMVYWIYGYFAFEWLFFATKSSVVSSADWPVRILMLLVPPLSPLLGAIPLQMLFSAMDDWCEHPRHWWSAIMPATMALLLLVIGCQRSS